MPLDDLEPQSPLLTQQLVRRWQQLWLLALDRQYRLEQAQQHLREARPGGKGPVSPPPPSLQGPLSPPGSLACPPR